MILDKDKFKRMTKDWGMFEWCALSVCILMSPAMIMGLSLVFVGPFALLWEASHPSKTITLQASHWECSSTYLKRSFTGKVWVTTTECSNYSLRNQP